MRLARLLEGTGVLSPGCDPEITGIACDSRRVEPGFLFVAVKGFKTDGRLFVPEAMSRGAAAAVVEEGDAFADPRVLTNSGSGNRELLALLAARFFREPWNGMGTAGITGTNGKTSTAHMLAWILESRGTPTGILGTVGHTVAGRTLPADVTTPDSLRTAELMRAMVDGGDGACVMEVSSHALSLARVDRVRFDAAVFTNMSQDHLDFHGTMEEYLKAKLRLLDLLKPGGTPVIGSASPEWPPVPGAVRFGFLSGDDYRILRHETGIQGSRYDLATPRGVLEVVVKAPGTFSIVNSAGAVAAAAAMGVPPEESAAALSAFPGVPGRMEVVDNQLGILVAVDYAHTPDALERVLVQGRKLTRGRLISVFGCGGDRDARKRPIMGAVSRRLAHLSVVTSDNPRTEDPMGIIQGILSGMEDMENVVVEPDRRRAIRLAIARAEPGDVVIIAGKGHEDYQILGTAKVPFDDREEARAALRESG